MANYIEYVLFAKSVSNGWQTDIGQAAFQEVLKKYARNNTNSTQKEYKEFVYGDIYYHNMPNNEIKVYRLNPLSSTFDNNCLCVRFNKQKLSMVNVPSTKCVDSIRYVKHLVYRISNRVFLNFVVKMDNANKHLTFTVYVNYNHDNNVDMQVITKQLNKVFKQLQEPIS